MSSVDAGVTTSTTLEHALQHAHALGLARLDAQWLLLHALQKPVSSRAWLLAHDSDAMTAPQSLAYHALLERRAAGEPLAYLVGHKEFFGLDLAVDARVLVPRPDTETLVHWALEVLEVLAASGNAANRSTLDVLDLGTGSGAIALAIAHTLRARGQAARVLAVDASTQALQVAANNARQLGLSVDFLHSDWLNKVTGQFHLIVSNPPYIAAADPHLAALHHEPLRALVSGADGLDDIRAIIGQASGHLQADGWLLLEHGYDQANAVCDMLEQAGFTKIGSRPDLAGIARCSGGQWPAFSQLANSDIIATN